MYQFTMPDIGEGTHETEITKWFVAEGDTITEDSILVEVESDKVVAELPCPVTGTIAKLHVPQGQKALVGSVIADILTNDNTPTAGTPTPETPATTPTTTTATTQPPASATSSSVDIRTLAVPGVRRYARSKGVDLTCITGSGNHGKITREDIDTYLANGATTQPATPAPTTEENTTPAAESTPQPATSSSGQRREKMSAIRKAAARALTEVVTTVPVVTILDRVEVSALVAHRNRLKDTAATREAKLTYTPYIVKACVAMLKKNPLMNGRVDMAAGEFIYYDTFNIGVATNTDRGLFVPIIKDADRKSLFDIAREITELSSRAKAGTLTSADMNGGSMTVTNVGGFATSGVWSTPIINAPEAAILGIGRFEDEFLPDKKGKPVLRPVCKLSFAFDHRLIDGVDAQKALNDLKEFLHNPDLLLAES